MNHDMTVESPESRVLNVFMSTVGKHSFIVAVAHTEAINEGDTITWAGRYGDKYHVKVVETEWWLSEDNKTYICWCTAEIISWY